MNSVDFKIRGTAPLLFNKEPEAFEDSPNRRKKPPKDEKPVDEARRHLHMSRVNGSKKQVPVIPAIWLKKCLQSVTGLALGRSTPGHPWVQIVKGGVKIEPLSMELLPCDWTMDVRRTGSKGRGGNGVLLHRPRFDEWSIEGTVLYDDRHLSEQDTRKLFDEGGRFQGLGSYRIGNGGPFGGFSVTEWKG